MQFGDINVYLKNSIQQVTTKAPAGFELAQVHTKNFHFKH